MRKDHLALGFTILSGVFAVSYAITNQPGLSLVLTCVALALLPPKYDPAIILKEWLQK